MTISGYLRRDGRKGIRNVLTVVYLVECAHHVCKMIAAPFYGQAVHVIGFPGCYPNAYAQTMLERLCTHDNVGAVLLVSLGCESFDRGRLRDAVAATGRPVETLVIQQSGGTKDSVNRGRSWVETTLKDLEAAPRAEMGIEELVIGTICGGSDATSGIAANPAIGHAFDALSERGAACIFEETGELIGCEYLLARRARTPELAKALVAAVDKARAYYDVLGHGSFALGNAEGQLSTQEEKSIGAYAKSGRSPIAGLLKPGDQPGAPGVYLLDVVPDGEVRYGFPNINDNAEIAELIACGSHLILFATGRGSVVGSAISPVIKICGNPETYRRMAGDMDVNAGTVIESGVSVEEVARQIYQQVLDTANGRPTLSEELGHQEFILTYKSFEPTEPNQAIVSLRQ